MAFLYRYVFSMGTKTLNYCRNDSTGHSMHVFQKAMGFFCIPWVFCIQIRSYKQGFEDRMFFFYIGSYVFSTGTKALNN